MLNPLSLIPGVNWARVLLVVAVLAVLEAPAAYLLVQRADLRHQLSAVTQKYDVDEQSIGTLRTQLSTSQADLASSQKAAQASSDSVGAYKQAMAQAQQAAFAAEAKNAQTAKQLQALAAKRVQQVAAPQAAKESCDAAIDDLRAGR